MEARDALERASHGKCCKGGSRLIWGMRFSCPLHCDSILDSKKDTMHRCLRVSKDALPKCVTVWLARGGVYGLLFGSIFSEHRKLGNHAHRKKKKCEFHYLCI